MSQKQQGSKAEPRKNRKKKKKGLQAQGWILLVLLALYLGYQFFGNMGQSIRTKEALITTVEETADAVGIFVRDQIPVTGQGGSSARYLVENGERVGKGQQVAVFFRDEASAQTFQLCQELEHQLSALRESYANLTSGMDSLKMDSLIYDAMQQLAAEMDRGRVQGLSQLYASLNQLVVIRGNADNGSEVLKDQIAKVEAELKAAKAQLSSGTKGIVAPEAGYFIKSSDGYEGRFTLAALNMLTADDIKSAAPDNTAGNVVGTLTQDFAWHYAAVVDKATAEALRNRTSISARFPKLSDKLVQMTIESIRTEGEEAVVVLKCTDMNARYLSARRESIQLVLQTYTGIPVPKEALRQVEGKWGVYCMEGSMAKFKPVNWIYQTEEYYLVPSAPRPEDGLYQYDKMILGAKNLADGQFVK